jgi:hypothetical protein
MKSPFSLILALVTAAFIILTAADGWAMRGGRRHDGRAGRVYDEQRRDVGCT